MVMVFDGWYLLWSCNQQLMHTMRVITKEILILLDNMSCMLIIPYWFIIVLMVLALTNQWFE